MFDGKSLKLGKQNKIEERKYAIAGAAHAS